MERRILHIMRKVLANVVKDATPRADMRHTWASWHIMAGTSIEVLQKLGGWADLKMVLRYAHLAPDHLASYANNSKPRDLDAVT